MRRAEAGALDDKARTVADDDVLHLAGLHAALLDHSLEDSSEEVAGVGPTKADFFTL